MVKISVIIPVYNCEKFIKDAIESVLAQTYRDFEIIIVNDGSTDGTVQVLKQFDCKVIHKENGGTASALNMGIKEAKGEWIKWLSADDLLKHDYMKIMMDEIYKTTDYQNKLFYTPYDIINAEDKTVATFEEPDRNNWTIPQQLEFFKTGFYGNGSSSLIHKSIFDKVGLFDESLPYFEDLDFWIRCIKHGVKLWRINQKLIRYRTHSGQLSNSVNCSLHNDIVNRLIVRDTVWNSQSV